MKTLNSALLDWLHNSWEHCSDPSQEAKEFIISQNLNLSERDQEDLIKETKALFSAWISNEYNLRITVELDYASDPKHYDEVVLKEFIRQYIKTVSV